MDLALNNQQWLMCHKTKPNISNYGKTVVVILDKTFQEILKIGILK